MPSIMPVHTPYTLPLLVTPVTKVLEAYHGYVTPVIDPPVSKFYFVFLFYIYVIYMYICLCVVYINEYIHAR